MRSADTILDGFNLPAHDVIGLPTSRKRFAAVRDAVKGLHSYDVPEIIALPIAEGSPDYLKWITESVDVDTRT